MVLVNRSWLLGLAVALAAGCGVEPAPEPVVSRAHSLARAEPRLSRTIGESRFDSAGRFTTSDDEVHVTLPARADGFVELRAGSRTKPLVRIRLLDAKPSQLAIERGVGVQRAALGDADVLWAATPDVLEQLVVLERSEDFAFRWEICPRAGLSLHREGNALRFDDRGETRLRIPEPFALDRDGVRRRLALELHVGTKCHTLELSLDARGLSAPILVDPAVEVVTWQQKTGAMPPARYDHGLAYDPVRKVSVLFGGLSESDTLLGDTWEWDGKVWKQKSPTTSPTPRSSFGITYSPLHGGVVLFAGRTSWALGPSSTSNEAWKYDGNTWSPLPSGAPGFWGHGLAYDAKRGVVVKYGGNDVDDFPTATVWELGATSWNGPLKPTTTPGQLSYFAMTYDSVMERTLVYGGIVSEPFHTDTDATWAWDGTSWTEVTAAPNAGVAFEVATAFDQKRGRNVYYGGTKFDGGDRDETWELSVANGWEKRNPLTKPPFLQSSKATYDAARDRVVMFGGWSLGAKDYMFEYVHFGNTCSVADDCDGYPCVDGVCCSEESCGTCEACSAVTGKCAPVTSADDPDSCTGTSTCNAEGSCSKKNGQGCGNTQECASGFCAGGVCCNSVCNASCESCGLTGSVGTCSLVVGSAANGTCPGTGPCGSSCDGNRPECSFAPAGIDCGTTCTGNELTERLCDGSGECTEAAPEVCAQHYVCGSETSCNQTCTDQSDCTSGFLCIDSVCTDGKAICLDPVTAQDSGGKKTSCVPYRCVDGACPNTCNSAAECAEGSLCTKDRRCQPAPDSPSADEGCGCRMHRESNGGWLVLASIAVAFARRRTRS